MAIQRLLKRSGQFTSKERNKLDQYFGTDEWYNLLYDRAHDMFGENITKKQNSGDVLVKWYRERLKKVFRCVSTAREVRSSLHPDALKPSCTGNLEYSADAQRISLGQGSREVNVSPSP